jgi:spermidine synthase
VTGSLPDEIPACSPGERRGAAVGLGILSQAIQILLLRQFLTISGSGELVVGGAMAAWLTGWGIGCLVADRSRRRLTSARLWRALILLVLAGWTFTVACANGRELLDLPLHTPLAPLAALGLAAVFLAPPAVLAGTLFGALTRGLEPAAARHTYLLESCGSLTIGVFLSTPFWEVPGVSGTFVILALTLALLRAIAMFQGRNRLETVTRASPARQAPLRSVGAIAILVVVIMATAPGLSRPWMRMLADSRVAEQRELRQGSAVALESHGQVSLYVGGHLADSWPARQEREGPVALAVLQHPKPERLLLWGGRATLFVRPSRALAVDRVTLLVEDRSLLDFQLRHFPGLARELADPAVTLAVSELRAYLAGHPGEFDVMILDSANPSTALSNRVFTAEGLLLARGALVPGGVLVLPLASSSSAGTLGPVFDEVRAVPGEEEYLLARVATGPAGQPLCLDGRALATRMAARPPLPFLTPEQLADSVPRIATKRLEKAYREAEPRAVNTDDHPIGYILSNRALAEVSARGGRVSRIGLILLALALAGLAGLLARPGRTTVPGTARPLVALTLLTGVGMVCQVILLLMFQTMFGSLYREIGLITGLALGGVALGSSPLWDRWSWVAPVRSLSALAMMTAVSAGVVGMIPRFGLAPAAAYALTLLMAAWMGVLGGRAFARALEEVPPGVAIAPRAYAADMLGAAGGAILTAGFLAPTLGFTLTAGAGAAVSVAAAAIARRATAGAAAPTG